MALPPGAMSNETFYGYMYPRQSRRYYLALVFSILLFPVIALGLVLGTVVLIVPFMALLLWMGMRVFFAQMLGNSVLVSAENYPRILATTEELKAKFGYTKPIYVFVYEQGSFNAALRHLFFRRAIFLNSELLQNNVTDREVRWLIGRFVGYMRARKQAGFLGWVIRAAQHLLVFNIFILPYERAMVYTGDRLALAEIDGDITTAASAIQKLLVGRDLGYSINPEGLIAQHRQVKGSFFALLARMGGGFPHTTSRYVDLVLFTRAFFPEQFKVFESANPGLPADIAQLGLSQLTEAGQTRPAHAPRGWTCATITLAALLAVGWGAWQVVASALAHPIEPTETVALSTPSPVTDAAVFTPASSSTDLAPVVSPPSSSLPPPPPPSPLPSPPPPAHTHYGGDGKLYPDEGCRWRSNDPNDVGVVCGDPPVASPSAQPVSQSAPPAPPQVVHVGGAIKEPRRIKEVQPVYPQIAVAAKVEGLVLIEATIGKDGSVTNTKVLRSVALLDQAAIDAVRQWKYTPTLLNGMPVEVVMTVSVNFTLR